MRRTRQAVAWVAVVAAVGSFTTAAVLADGREGTESTTNDGGAWLINRAEGVVGHVNRVVGEVDSVAGPFTGSFDVTQAPGMVVVNDRAAGHAVLIDTKLSAPGAKVTIPANTALAAMPRGVVAYNHATGKLWRISKEEFGTLRSLDDLAPDVELESPGVFSVGLDGRIIAVSGDGTSAHLATPDGVWSQVTLGEPDSPSPVQAVTVVGSRSVVLHQSGSLSVVDTDDKVKQFSVSNAVNLQQPSAELTSVAVVHNDTTISTVDLDNGDEAETTSASAVGIRPIVHRGCIWSITTEPTVFHYCGRQSSLNARGESLRLMLVNDWVWVNDVNTGGIWFVRDDDLEVSEISDWSAALLRNEELETDDADGGGDEEIVVDATAEKLDTEVDSLDKDGTNEPPIAVDDTDATRRGRPVVVDALANDTDPDNDPLSVDSLRGVDVNGFTADGSRVTISADGSVIQVVPDVDFVGTVKFGYVVTDGRGEQDSASVSVDVTEPDERTNRAPNTVVDNATVRAGESVSLNVLTNDSDPDGDVLVLTAVGDADGAVGFTPDGEVQFTPNIASPEGTVDIDYTVVDDFNLAALGTVRVRVRPAGSNQTPQARNDVTRGAAGRSVTMNVLTNDYDPDGDPLIAQNLQTADGSTTTATLGPEGQFLFRPERAGSYRFTYTVSDGPSVDVAQIQVTASEAAENRPPVAVSDEVALAVGETRLVRVLDNDGDPDGDVIGLVDWARIDGLIITEVPQVGFYVTPTPSASPRSQFRYWISDGVNDRTMGTVVVSAIDREAVDYPPVAVVDTIDARAGSTTTVHVLRNDHDPEGRPLEIAAPVATPPEARVRISPDKQALLLTVNRDQEFSFTFSYDTTDPAGNRGSALVNVRVVPQSQTNRAPLATPDVATTPFETPVTVTAIDNDRDPDGDPIAIESISEQPAHGSVELLDNGALRYTPRSGFSGTDRFVYTLVDGYQAPVDADGEPIGDSGPERDRGEVLIGVMSQAAANRPPIAVNDENFAPLAISSDPVELNVLKNDTDPDNDYLVVNNVSEPSVGSVEVSPSHRSVMYTPPADGPPRTVSFNYTATDGRGGSATATVTLQLAEAPDPIAPIAIDDSVGPVSAGSITTFDPRANDLDPDGDPTLLEVVATDPAIRVRADGRIDITAPPGNQELEYQVRDEQGLLSEPAFISVIVAVNEAPVVSPIRVETPFDTAIDIDLSAAVTDPDDDRMVITLGSQRAGGAVRPLDRGARTVVRFTPDTDFEGEASFDFIVDDLNAHVVTGTAVITVLPPKNRKPKATDQTVTADAGVDLVVRLPELVTDPDGPDGHIFSVANVTGPISLQGPSKSGDVIVSSKITSGGSTAGFDYTVVDGPHTITKHVTVNIAVAKYPAPTLASDSAQTLQDQSAGPIQVLANDVDNTPPGLPGGLTITNVGVSSAGTASVSGSSIMFTPNPGFYGTATFTYTVQDTRRSAEGEASATVSVAVIGRPATPLAPAVDSVGDGYTIVSWNPPAGDAARAPVTGYELRYVGADGTSGAITFDQPTTSHRWDGLTNGVQYCFSVAAINAAGIGEFSEVGSSTSCGTPDVRPEAPAAPIVTFGDTQLSISWSEPLNRGSTIKNYQLRISGGAQQLSPELGAVTNYTWKKLENGTDYTFEVRAQNSAADNDGWSDWSPLSASEHPLTIPDAPNQPVAKRGDRQVLVTWQSPYNGGDAITRYEVRSSLADEWIAAPVQGETNTYRWENIPNGTEVSFEVRGVNRDPRSTTPGNISVSSPKVRTCAVPDPPAAPTAVRGDTTATVTWVAPNAQGCDITEYQITASNGAMQTVSGAATSHVFTGLTNGTAYTFTVTAINEVVTVDGVAAKPSPPSNEVIPAGPPFATNVVSATNVAPRTVSVSWTPADANGSPIIRYEISIDGAFWVDVGLGTEFVRTEASDGATYTYIVRAVNDVGPGPFGGAQSVTTWAGPGAPQVSASVGIGRFDASWTTPSDGGTALTGHEAKLISSASSCTEGGDVLSNPGSPHRWSGLPDGVGYRACVRYLNAVGWGPWGTAELATPMRKPSISANWGATVPKSSSCQTTCRYVDGTAVDFPPGSSVTFECWSTYPSGAWKRFGKTATRTVDSDGRASISGLCYFGFTNHVAQLRIGSVKSNSLKP